jgi:hypothetical protein
MQKDIKMAEQRGELIAVIQTLGRSQKATADKPSFRVVFAKFTNASHPI